MIRPALVFEFVRSTIRIARAQGRLVPLPGEDVEQIERDTVARLTALGGKPERAEFVERFRPKVVEMDVGGKRRMVPVHPVRGVSSANQATVRGETSPDGTRITIKATPLSQLIGAIILALGASAAAIGAHTFVNYGRDLFTSHVDLSFHSLFDALWTLSTLQSIFVGGVFLVVGLFFVLVGLIFVLVNPPTVVFDSAEQMFWLGKRRGGQSRPFSDLLALQIIPGKNEDRDEGDPLRYQLNLLLDDALRPRYNLCEHTELSQIEELAANLSNLTGKPVIRA